MALAPALLAPALAPGPVGVASAVVVADVGVTANPWSLAGVGEASSCGWHRRRERAPWCPFLFVVSRAKRDCSRAKRVWGRVLLLGKGVFQGYSLHKIDVDARHAAQ